MILKEKNDGLVRKLTKKGKIYSVVSELYKVLPHELGAKVKVKVKTFCGSYSTSALRHIVLLRE